MISSTSSKYLITIAKLRYDMVTAKELRRLGLVLDGSESLSYLLDERTSLNKFGPKTAERIQILREICTEYRTTVPKVSKLPINSHEDALNVFLPVIDRYLAHEEVWVAYVNQGNRLVDVKRISVGTESFCIFPVRDIIKGCLDCHATGIIACHTHPSGNPYPSTDDTAQTKILKESCKPLGLRLLDHLIISIDKYYSYSEEGCFKIEQD